jgi:hypothetical protein
MASGITHILLMKNLQKELPIGATKRKLAQARDILQVGAIAPDLPYASIADNDFILKNDSELADLFHYEKTNELPLKAFFYIKEIKNDLTKTEVNFLFAFFIGYVSHLIADGIIHPYVRDKVGDYAQNKTAHRVLEMQIDVLLFEFLTKHSGKPLNLNYTNLHEELANFEQETYPQTSLVIKTFSNLIKDVYNYDCSVNDLFGWVKAIYRMFAVAEGDHPAIYRNIGFIKPFLFPDLDELRDKNKDILVLTKPVDRIENFLKQPKIDFFDDCIPMFYKKFIPVLNKAYEFVYNDGEEITELDIKGIDLDTGRDLAVNNDLNEIPLYWS